MSGERVEAPEWAAHEFLTALAERSREKQEARFLGRMVEQPATMTHAVIEWWESGPRDRWIAARGVRLSGAPQEPSFTDEEWDAAWRKATGGGPDGPNHIYLVPAAGPVRAALRLLSAAPPASEALREALLKIADWDPTTGGAVPHDEWAEASAFQQVQELARAALADSGATGEGEG